MMRRMLVLAACGVMIGGAHRVLGQTPQDQTHERELHPASLRLATLHRTHFIRTPDGAMWDLWGEREYLKVYNRAVEKEPVKEKRTAEGWTSWITVGYRWEVNERSRDAAPWGIVPNGQGEAPEYFARKAADLPPLWVSATGAERRFIYINEEEPDVRTRDAGTRSTQVLADLGNKLYKIAVRAGRGLEDGSKPRQPLEAGAFVIVPDARDVEDGYLPGEFILWPDDSIALPPGHDGPRYWYLPVEQLHPSPEALVEAIEAGEAAIVEWRYEHRSDRWVRQEVPLQYRERREATHDTGKEPAQEREPAPSIPITHLLVLTNGDWVEGQLVAEDETGVLFRVVVAGISTERRYSRDEVARVVEK